LKQVALLLSKQNQFSYTARPVASACRAACQLVTRLAAPLVVDYFAYATRPGASARRAARHAARRRLLHLRRTSGCFGTSCGSSRGSSLTTLPTPRVRVPRHIAWLISPLVVDYFASARLVAQLIVD
jgi:hypothetical protein